MHAKLFWPLYFGELKPYNSKYCSNFILFVGLQLIFAPFNIAVLFDTRNSRNQGHANIKGFTVHCVVPLCQFHILLSVKIRFCRCLNKSDVRLLGDSLASASGPCVVLSHPATEMGATEAGVFPYTAVSSLATGPEVAADGGGVSADGQLSTVLPVEMLWSELSD